MALFNFDHELSASDYTEKETMQLRRLKGDTFVLGLAVAMTCTMLVAELGSNINELPTPFLNSTCHVK